MMSNDLLDKIENALNEHCNSSLSKSLEFDQLEKMYSRTNTIMHVCWQRTCNISFTDYRYALTVSFNIHIISTAKIKFIFLIGFIQWIFITQIQKL